MTAADPVRVLSRAARPTRIQMPKLNGVVFGASLAARIVGVFATAPARPAAAFPELTDREREVLDLIAAGKSNAQIAAALFLSPRTVRNNVSMILAKLHATDRPTMIIEARDAGFGTDR